MIGSGLIFLPSITITHVNANTPPSIYLLSPQGGETLSGLQEIKWSAFDPDFDNLTFSLWYSALDAWIWVPLIENYTQLSFLWDTTTVQDGRYFLKLLVFDGKNVESSLLAQPIQILNNLPFDDNLILTGIPYPIRNLEIGNNMSFFIDLSNTSTYSVYLYGDYLDKNVDLTVYAFLNQSDPISRTQLENSPHSLAHFPGKSDHFSFSPNQTGIYQILIENDFRYSTAAAEAKILIFELWTAESSSKMNFSSRSINLNATGLEISAQSDFRVYLIVPEIYLDQNFSINAISSVALQIELRIQSLFDLIDLDQYVPLAKDQNIGEIYRAEEEGQLLTGTHLISNQEPSLDGFGLIVFVQAITGQGNVTLTIQQTSYYSLDTIRPPGLPLWINMRAGETRDIKFLLEKTRTYAFLLDLPMDSQEGWNLFLFNHNKSVLLDSVADFSRNGTKLEITNQILPNTGRYVVQITRDNSTVENSTVLEFAWLFVTEIMTDFNLPTRVDLFRGNLNSTPTLKTYSSVLLQVNNFQGQKLIVRIDSTNDLRVTATIHAFTTGVDRMALNYSQSSQAILDYVTARQNGNSIILTVSQIGFRGYEKVATEYLLVTLEAIAGEGVATISVEITHATEDWFRFFALFGTLFVMILSVIVIIALEKKLT